MSLATVKDNRIESYQQNSVYLQNAACNPFTFYHAFANEFEQYNMAFSGYFFPVQGVRYTFYEDFIERQMHNVVVTKPFQRHVLTRESFLGFLHQLFEIVKDKVDPNWKPTAVLQSGQNWTTGCPKHLASLREVPYNTRIIAEHNNELQTYMDKMDNEGAASDERVSGNNSSLALAIKRTEQEQQKYRSFVQPSNVKVSDENVSLFHVFEEQFEQYYLAFPGFIFPVHGVCFIFYEDFVERQFHNYAVARPLQRQVLTSESFLRFLHQLFEVAKNKVYASWLPSAVLCCGSGWTEGCPEHLKSLRDVPYTYSPGILEEESKEVQTNMEVTDTASRNANNEMSANNSSIDLENKGVESSKGNGQLFPLNQTQQNSFARLSEVDSTVENVTLFNFFMEEFEEYYMTFTGCLFPVLGVCFTFYEDFVDRQTHNFAVSKPLQRHVLTRENFLRFLHQLFEIAKGKVDSNWKPTVVVSCGPNWTEGCPEHLQSLRVLPYSRNINATNVVGESKELQTNRKSMGSERVQRSDASSQTKASLDLAIKALGSLKREEYPSFVTKQHGNGFAHRSNVHISGEHLKLFQIFKEQFEQYYLAFTGWIFPVQGVGFTFYEDFVDRQIHNYVVAKPLQRHVLTRESFLRFLHQLFEIAKNKVDPGWKPTAVASCGVNWTEGCPKHLESLKNVPYSYDKRISMQGSKELPTNVHLTDNKMDISKGEMSSNKNSSDIEIRSVESLKYKKKTSSTQEQHENGFALVSNAQFSKENISLFNVFEEEFDQYYVAFRGCLLNGYGVNCTFQEDLADRQIHNMLLTIPLQRHILTQTNFQGFLHQLFEVAKNKVDAGWKPTVVARCGGLNWTEGCPKLFQGISQLQYSYSTNTIVEQSEEMQTRLSENNCPLDLEIKSVDCLTSDKNFTLFQIFKEEFWQYYVAFSGYIFPVDGVHEFTFYEDFVDRQLHNFVTEKPFQRHILTRESFHGFKHQLFEIAKSKCDPSWKPTVVPFCGPSWTEGCPKHLQSLRHVPYSYNAKIIVEESNQVQKHVDLCDNENNESFESNSSSETEIGEKQTSFAVEQQETGCAKLSKMQVFSDQEIDQTVSEDCVVKHEFGYRLFFKEFRSFYITFKASELQLIKGIVFQFYEDALEYYTHNVVLSEECQLSVLCDVNFKKFLRATLDVSRNKTDSKWQPTAAKFANSNVKWYEGQPAYMDRLQFIPIGYDKCDSQVEERNLSDDEEDDSDIGEEDQSDDELRAGEGSEESEFPESESETDEESSQERSEPLEEEIRASEKAAQGAEGLNKREEEQKTKKNETKAGGDAEINVGSGKQMQIAKPNETPIQITQGTESKAREIEAKDGDTNRELREKKEKGTDNEEHGSQAERAQLEKQKENQSRIQQHTLSNITSNRLALCNAALDNIKKSETIPTDALRPLEFNDGNTAPHLMDAEITREGKNSVSKPTVNRRRNSRKKKNIITGWLCSKIIKAFVKSKTLL